MKIYYLEDEKGNYLSSNGKRRFVRLVGSEVLSYIEENRSQNVYFYTTTTEEDLGDSVFVEIPKDKVSMYRSQIYHDQYLAKMKKKRNYKSVSIYHPIDNNDGTAVIDKYGDNGHTVEDAVIKEIDMEILRRSLKYLTDEELRMIRALYLSDDPLSERELCRKLGIPQKTLNYRKRRALDKLKKCF